MEPVESPRSLIKVTYGSLYFSRGVFSYSHFFLPFFFPSFSLEPIVYVTSRLTLGERNEIAATRFQKPAATSFLLPSCVKRA